MSYMYHSTPEILRFHPIPLSFFLYSPFKLIYIPNKCISFLPQLFETFLIQTFLDWFYSSVRSVSSLVPFIVLAGRFIVQVGHFIILARYFIVFVPVCIWERFLRINSNWYMAMGMGHKTGSWTNKDILRLRLGF